MTGSRKGQEDRAAEQGAPLAEWVVGGIGVMLVSAAILVLTDEALQGETSPPAVAVSVLGVDPQPEGWLVEILVTNQGATTASGLGIEGSLKRGDRVIETSEAIVDYLPPHSQRRAGLFFTHSPLELELQVRPTGYQEP